METRAREARDAGFREGEAAAQAQAQEQVRAEPVPTPESIWDHFYANNENGDWRKF